MYEWWILTFALYALLTTQYSSLFHKFQLVKKYTACSAGKDKSDMNSKNSNLSMTNSLPKP